MEEQPIIEVQTQEEAAAAEQPRYKTLGVRLEEGLHAQLSFIAQLTGSTLADEIRGAIEGRVVAAQSDPDMIARAAAVRAEIEREAAARREAIAGFFGAVSVEQGSEPRSGTTTVNRRPVAPPTGLIARPLRVPKLTKNRQASPSRKRLP